jgi:hypothetical protein
VGVFLTREWTISGACSNKSRFVVPLVVCLPSPPALSVLVVALTLPRCDADRAAEPTADDAALAGVLDCRFVGFFFALLVALFGADFFSSFGSGSGDTVRVKSSWTRQCKVVLALA